MPVPKFIFVRHGEAEHNVAFHKEGDAAFTNPAYKDAPLTAEGRKQAQATGEALRDLPILDIWSSPSTRAIQTAEEIYEEVNAQELWLHDSLLERQGGGHVCNERKYRMDLKKEFPIWKREFLPELAAAWVDAENETSLQRRMLSFTLLLAHMYGDVPDRSHVVIVSHANALGALLHRSFKNAEHVVLTLEEVLAIASHSKPDASAAAPSNIPTAQEEQAPPE